MNDKDVQLTEHIVDIRERLKQGEYDSEAAVSNGVVKRLLEAVGWPRYDQQVVRPEFPIETRKVDFALCDPPGKPQVLLEVKAVGSAGQKGEDQLFQYCFRKGVKLAVLTDGRTWKLYYPYGGGEYSDRLFHDLDIIDDDETLIAETLQRFLAIDAVKSGVAFERCEEAYAQRVTQRKAAEAFGTAWNTLLTGPNDVLVDLFTEKVKELTTIRPQYDAVVRFLRKQAEGDTTEIITVPQEPKGPEKPPRDGENSSSPSYTLRGATTHFRTAREVFVDIFRAFAVQDPTFCERYARTQRTGGKRLELARRAADLYPPGSKWVRTDASELPGGWWIATHLSNELKQQRIQRACEVMGIEYGRELLVSLSK